MHKPETSNDPKYCELYMKEAKELDLQFYTHRLDVSPSKGSTLIITCRSSSSLPVDLLLHYL